MEPKTLSRWLKCIIIGTGFCGLLFYIHFMPFYAAALLVAYPEFYYCYWPWVVFLWITGVPCYVALVFAWKIAANIGRDHSFSLENAKLFGWITRLAAADTVFFLGGNIALFVLNMNHPGVMILSLFVVFIGIAVAVVCATLSQLVRKAAALQEQSDWTI